MTCRSCKTNNIPNNVSNNFNNNLSNNISSNTTNKPKDFFDFSFFNNTITATLATGPTGITGCEGGCLAGTGPERFVFIQACAQQTIANIGICDTLVDNITYLT